MTSFKMNMPIICLGCNFQADDTCVLSKKMITEEDLYDRRPDHCYLKPSDVEGWVDIDIDKIPADTVLNIGMTDVDSMSSAEPI
jgi:hypothetical protein